MISQTKPYRTKDGHKVRIYATDGGGHYPIHGAIYVNNLRGWETIKWTAEGKFAGSPGFDIVEVEVG